MRKVYIALALLVMLTALTIGSLFAILHTPFAANGANYFLKSLNHKIQVETLTYEFPWHFTAQNVTFGDKPNAQHIDQVELWINPDITRAGKLAIDSIVIDGFTLTEQHDLHPLFDQIFLYQLAFNNADIDYNGLIGHGVNAQFKEPQWEAHQQLLPFGSIQLSANHFYYQGEAIDDFLIDVQYQPKDSTVYGASFIWRETSISGQAEQFDSGWSLINVTIDKLNLSDDKPINRELIEQLTRSVHHINSLDLLTANIEFKGISAQNLDLSLENIYPAKNLWQQQGYLSFHADTLTYQDLKWVDATAKLALDSNAISVTELDTDFEQGRLQLAGVITPNSLHLDLLKVNGIKWTIDERPKWLALLEHKKRLEALSVAQVDIANSQVIQLFEEPYWQLSGFNARGRQLELLREKQLGLWNGQLEATANSASYGELITSQAIIETQSRNGQWSLDRFYLPLDQGYVDISGVYDMASRGHPWALDFSADGLPSLPVLTPFIAEAWQLDGLLEVTGQLNGFASDSVLFEHSLHGELTASAREATLLLSQELDGVKRSLVMPFEPEPVHVNAKRGQITITTHHNGEGQLSGKIDLVDSQHDHLYIELTQPCQKARYELLSGALLECLATEISDKE
ncbi:AsmA family protein [Vibrio mexicanus]|uniref:AsmA family protein n=1 Tax=Vibrio mexicanus TaxID=1004326 RepID=UPI00063CB017|nr:AsmA family protein [Vibrio mexicanus]